MSWFVVGWAGFVAVVLATGLVSMFRVAGLTEFSPSVHLGCLFVRSPQHPAADTIGFSLLLVVGSTALPAIYAKLLEMLGGPTLARGLFLGAIHGLIVAALLPLLGTISACVRAGAVPKPGPLGVRWGWLTPLAIVLGHGLYGAVCGAIWGNL